MDGSDKCFSSSTPIKPSSIPKLSASDAGGDTNENDQKHHQMGGSKLQNPKKPTTKNFMSPTFSATSKVNNVPRKKILTERNEASSGSIFSHIHLQKTPNLNSNVDNSGSHVTPLSSRLTESDDDEQNIFVPDSSSRPYDPLTNYLSPRPKFLRYKPNRRREVFLRQELEIEGGKDGSSVKRSVSFDSQRGIDEEASGGDRGSSASSSQGGSVKQGEEEIDNSEGYDDDDDEEEEEVIEEERGWSMKGVLKSLLVLAVLFLSTLYISSMNSSTPSTSLRQAARWGLKDIQNYTIGADFVKSFEGGSEFLDQIEETQMGFVKVNQRVSDDGFEEEEMGLVEIQGGGSEDVCDHELEKTMEVSDQFQGIGIAEEFESFHDYQMPFMSDWVDHRDTVSDILSASENEVNSDTISNVEQEVEDGVLMEGKEELAENEMERVEDVTNEGVDEIVLPESMDNDNTNFDVPNTETEVNMKEEELVDHAKTESIPKAVLGVSILSLIAASFVLGCHFKRKKNSEKDSLAVVKPPCSESVIAGKSSSVLLPNEEEEHIEKVDSFVNPSSLIHSMEEASKDDYQSRAPTVELLGEMVVGEVSSSLKSCGMKSKMMESEESNHSVSQERSSRTKSRSVPSNMPRSLSELSTMDSPSFGSFTAQGKIVKKEEGKESVRKEVTTPVRRSIRIRSRAVMSP